MAPRLPPDSALRVQLEGRWERIEQAQERYAELLRQLGSRQWRDQLRSEPELLASVREQEPGLDEVIAYVERRAQLERWPKDHPGPAALGALRSQRARLEALGRKRLTQWGLPPGESFAEVLSGLEARALVPLPQPPEENEPVLAEGRFWIAGGRFWLTPQRLVWSPWRGEPQQLSLDTLSPERISLLPGAEGVRLEGDRRVTLTGVPRARSLAVLLKLYSRKWKSAGAHVHELISRRAYLDILGSGREQDRAWGVCLLQPGYMAFLPERRPTWRDRLRHLVGAASRSEPAERRRLDVLVNQLRKLPAEEFNQHLKELVRVRGGMIWPSIELHRARNREGQGPRILIRRRSVLAIPEARPGFVEQYFQQHWPNTWTAIRSSWWRRHSTSLLLLLISVGWWVLPLLSGALPRVGMSFFHMSNVLWVLAFMRYARVKGYPPLLGLLALTPCIGWIILVALHDKNEPRD